MQIFLGTVIIIFFSHLTISGKDTNLYSHTAIQQSPKPNHHQLQFSCAACKRPSPLRRHALTGGGGQSPGTCTGVSSHFFQPVLAILPQLQPASRFQAEARVSMLGAGKICTVPESGEDLHRPRELAPIEMQTMWLFKATLTPHCKPLPSFPKET